MCCGGEQGSTKGQQQQQNKKDEIQIKVGNVPQQQPQQSASTATARAVQTNYDELFKIVSGSFSDNFMPTVGVDLKVRFLNVDGKTIKIQIWDTAGQERFRNLTRSYYRGSDGVILLYDITQEKSFTNLTVWLNEVKKNILGLNNGESIPHGSQLNLFIIGNKTDLENSRQVTTDRARKFCETLQMDVLFDEISCKNTPNETIEQDILCKLSKKILESRQKENEIID
ncbi:hypothetical protein C9374_006028 [Naegleria lovaniensis]|uniref:Rab family small GTPase n=1 Tax=Naegleria lovaniensis TaxID=51637 RepID=A0AA88GIK6_NAELO|nr:uncharacterized protein C9374_006028 [Naegleria lovaniensis]KAG2381644.1 hypothetical protein C9374_006028 [Naegleria lovaniensis]